MFDEKSKESGWVEKTDRRIGNGIVQLGDENEECVEYQW